MAKPKAKKPPPARRKPAPTVRAKKKPAPVAADPSLFLPLSPGEKTGALRLLLDDERLRETAKIGRYRVIAVEPLVLKSPDTLANRRLARAILFDYAGDRCVDACVDLDAASVVGVTFSQAQPMLSPEEEHAARAIAAADPRLDPAKDGSPLGVYHYWSKRAGELAYRRRSAAVVFKKVVAVVDLMDGVVSEICPTEVW